MLGKCIEKTERQSGEKKVDGLNYSIILSNKKRDDRYKEVHDRGEVVNVEKLDLV